MPNRTHNGIYKYKNHEGMSSPNGVHKAAGVKMLTWLEDCAHASSVVCLSGFFGDYLQRKYETYQLHYHLYFIIMLQHNIGKFVCLVANSPTRDTRTNHTITLTRRLPSLSFSRCNPFDVPCYCCFLIFLSGTGYTRFIFNDIKLRVKWKLVTAAIAVHFPWVHI